MLILDGVFKVFMWGVSVVREGSGWEEEIPRVSRGFFDKMNIMRRLGRSNGGAGQCVVSSFEF